MDRGWMRIGGWGAIVVALGGVARLILAAALYGAVEINRAPGAVHLPWDLLLGAIGVLTGLAQGSAVEGVRQALRPDTRLLWTVTAVGWVAALLTTLAALYPGYRFLLHAPVQPSVGLWLGLLTAFITALWIAGVCAADWRLRRLPTWLRVVGTTFAMLSFLSAILTPLVLLTIPLALVWWFGLGASLLRRASGSSAGVGG